MALTVTEMKKIMEQLEFEGHGNIDIHYGLPSSLGHGVEGVTGANKVELNTLFGNPIVYIRGN